MLHIHDLSFRQRRARPCRPRFGGLFRRLEGRVWSPQRGGQIDLLRLIQGQIETMVGKST